MEINTFVRGHCSVSSSKECCKHEQMRTPSCNIPSSAITQCEKLMSPQFAPCHDKVSPEVKFKIK